MSLEIRMAISPKEIDDAKSVRILVFQNEQGIPGTADFDGEDTNAIHFVTYDGNPIGAARVRFPKTKKRAKIERVAVLAEYRGKGIGKKIMQSIDVYLAKIGTQYAYLDSQEQAKGFYEDLGYVQEGELFEEVGIPHVVMVKSLKVK